MNPVVTPLVGLIIQPVVLLVDDDAHVLEALASELTPHLEPWFQVESAASADEALAIAVSSGESAPIAAVISDEKMPGRSGTELLASLRAVPAHRHGGRILLTGYAGLESAKRAINEAEIERYYAKPWDAAGQLLPALAEILGRFVTASGLARYHLATVAGLSDPDVRTAVIELRRATWEFVTLLGLPAEELGVEAPQFLVDGDEAATHLVIWGMAPRERVPIATARLSGGGDGFVRLEAQSFAPGARAAEIESLLVRTARAAARAVGARRLLSMVAGDSVPLYEALGFVPLRIDPTLGGAAELALELEPAEPRAAETAEGEFDARFVRERRACSCAQTACMSRDYAKERRGSWCPLDAAEGRGPAWMPRA